MSKTYRLACIGFAHMHVNDLLDAFDRLPSVEWVACADTVPAVPSRSEKRSTRRANLRRAQEVIGIPKVYDDYRALLDTETLDAVIVCAENARHPEVITAVAEHGLHVVTEKPMAADLAGALQIARACRANGVELMVNWPTTWSPAVRKMKELIDAGVIGDVWEIKWRNGASMGPLSYGTGNDAVTDREKGAEWWHYVEPGGGALLDYCCYGASLALWYLGAPALSASGTCLNMASHYGDAEDNAIITVRFPRAVAILEGTWTTWNVGLPTGPIAYGSRGCLVAGHRLDDEGRAIPAVSVFTRRSHGLEPADEIIEGDPLPLGRSTPAEEFTHHLETGEPLHPTLQMDHNVQAMAILDAGRRSASTGHVQPVEDATWHVG